jgi:hypothetical protein
LFAVPSGRSPKPFDLVWLTVEGVDDILTLIVVVFISFLEVQKLS